jgi:calcineurin-like phosphoesterase family protein
MDFKRKGIFFTSDWHIGHANSIIFDKRPFNDLDDMHESLIKRYNASVKNTDVCYFLGDIGLVKGDVIKSVISRLNGTKVLVLGNHDANTYSMYEKGFDVVINSFVFYIGTKRISASHCPLPGIKREDVTGMRVATEGENWHGESKNQMFMSFDNTVDFHLHGHIHSGSHNNKDKYTDKQMDVGVVANNYRPVSISEVESWVNKLDKNKKVV